MPNLAYEKAISQVIINLTATIANVRFYSLNHPQTMRFLDNAYTDLSDLLHLSTEITFFLVDNDLIVNNSSFSSSREQYIQKFISILKENSIERLTFLEGIPKIDFQDLIRKFSTLESESIYTSQFIKIGKVDLKVDESFANKNILPVSIQEEKIQELLKLRDSKLDELKELYHRIQNYKKIRIQGIDDIIQEFVKAFAQGIDPFRLLASLKSSDEYTFTHEINVCILTMSQASSLGFRGDHLYNIGIASLLHDSGNLFIPKEILTKPGKLTPDERAIIETHTVKGARYIMHLEEIPKLAVLSALEHHIRFDGTGYPKIRQNWKPNIVSQIISISDVFDAMRSRRPYQNPKPRELILKILQEEKGTSFNPFLVDHFLTLIEK